MASVVGPSHRLNRLVRHGVTWPSPRLLAVALILGAAIWHLGYLAFATQLDLAADEAHYWTWSRHLDWSYYSKGPLIAWLIRASCAVFGPLSTLITGDEALAVRMPATICGIGQLAGLYVLASRTLKSERHALAAVAAAVTLPAILVGSTLMTIDAPYGCAWVWALVFGHAAVFRGERGAWLAAGLTVAIGILAKYTMALWVPGMFLFLVSTPSHRRELARSGFWMACVVAACGCLPVLIWNMGNGWVTFRHVGWQAGATATGIRWHGPLQFVIEQALLWMVFWFNGYIAAMWTQRPGKARTPELGYLWWMSAIVFGLFWFASLRTQGQVNWPATAYVAGLILAVDWVAIQLSGAHLVWRRTVVVGLSMGTAAGLFVGFGLHFPSAVRPLYAALSSPPTTDQPAPIRRLDPTSRLRGWKTLAHGVDRVRARLEAEGAEPIIAASFWTLPGEIEFYGRDHPTVYCFGPALGQRVSQFDLWRPNPIWDPEEFRGRTVIFVGDVAPELTAAFDRVDPSWRVEHHEGGHLVAYWNVTVGRGYRGFGPPAKWSDGLHY